MLCEKAYYPNKTGENRENIYCSDERVTDFFDGMCPLVYYCTISEKFENTTDMFNCKFREIIWEPVYNEYRRLGYRLKKQTDKESDTE